ncbi:MAG: long-chain fatty acid--CoA ligase [bacterium]|nr:long-chain fatty acid--CoA ligase [bacterium]
MSGRVGPFPAAEQEGGPSELIRALESHASERPHELAIREDDVLGSGRQLTWQQLRDAAARLRGQLLRLSTDRIVLMLAVPNRIEAQIGLIGGLWAGADVLPVSPVSTETELRGLARRARVSLLIGDAAPRRALDGEIEQIIPVESLLEGESPAAGESMRCGPGVILLQSSGTTGLPKIVRRPASVLDAVGRNLCRALELRASDLMLVTIPLHHSYGIDFALMGATIAGCATELHSSFVPGRVRSALVAQRVSVWPAVPLMLDAVSASTGVGQPPALRRVISAGSPLPRRVFDQFEHCFGVRVGQVYGATEFGSVTYNDPADPDFDPDCCGRPLARVQLKLVRSDDPAGHQPLPAGAEGEVLVSAPSMLSGYVDSDDEPYVDGFVRSGDLGTLDDQGRLRLTGRLKLMIDVGAQSVNPLEVEACLARHPTVSEAVVIPVPFSDTAERLKAIAIPKRGEQVDSAALKRFAREHLAALKVPRVIEVREDVPRSPTGKILRGELIAAERAARAPAGGQR